MAIYKIREREREREKEKVRGSERTERGKKHVECWKYWIF